MPKGRRILLKNASYHITTRGNQKQAIFFDEQDYQIYLSRLKKYKLQHGFLLYGYCLMPNHVHIIGEPKTIENLAKFMHGLNRSYTAYFNKKYNKVGHLWQGRFKSKVIAKETYLLDCTYYVELNPVRSNIVKNATDYKWSSYKERFLADNNKKTKMLDELHI